jgi:predicted O-linked N-acetylglucosamine transferase (SPINDLY family)
MQTLGMKAIDWRITDYGATPKNADAFYTEKLYRLNSMVAYSPPLNADEQFVSPWHANGYITMACLNHSRKISDEAIVLWARILQAHPNSGLLLFSGEKGGQDGVRITQRMEQLGMPMAQVSVQERMTMQAFMRMASIADFAVDSLPVSGGTTTLHALWMGLPIITLDSSAMGAINGATASILKGIGLSDFVATDSDAYVHLVGKWIGEPHLIDEARNRTRPSLQSSALMAHAERVQEVESAYRHMWVNYVH